MPVLGVSGDLLARKDPRIGTRRRKPVKKHKQRSLRLKENNPVRRYQAYALELEDGKYYVGITGRTDVQKRLAEHLKGKGAKWTVLHNR